MPSAGRSDPVRRLRGRQGLNRRGYAQDLAILRDHVHGVDASDLCSGPVPVAACSCDRTLTTDCQQGVEGQIFNPMVAAIQLHRRQGWQAGRHQ